MENILLYSALIVGVLFLAVSVFTILKQQISEPHRELSGQIAKLSEDIRALDHQNQ